MEEEGRKEGHRLHGHPELVGRVSEGGEDDDRGEDGGEEVDQRDDVGVDVHGGVELVVRAEHEDAAPGDPQGEKHLARRGAPHLGV